MTSDYSLNVNLRGEDNLSPVLSEVSAKTERLTSRFKKLGRAGKWGMTHVTAPIALLGTNVFIAGMRANKAFAQLRANTKATTAEYAALNKQAKELGKTPLATIEEVTRAQQALLKVTRDFDGSLNLQVPEAGLHLAKVGALEAAEGAEILATTMKAFNVPASGAMRTASALAVASEHAGRGLGDIAGGLREVQSSAVGARIGLNETLAAVVIMSDAGIDMTRASSGLKDIIVKVTELQGNQRAGSVLKKLGIERGELISATGDLKSLQVLVEQFRDASLSDLTKVFGGETAATVNALLSKGPEELKALTAAIGADGEAVLKKSRELTGAKSATWDDLSRSWNNLMVKIGDSGALSDIIGLMKSLTDWIDEIAKTSPGLLKAGANFLAFVAIVAPVAVVTAKLVAAYQVLSQFKLLGKSKSMIFGLGRGLKHLGKVKVVVPWLVKTGRAVFSLGKFLGPAATAARVAAVAFWAMAAPFAPVILGALAVGAAAYGIYKYWKPITEFLDETRETFVSLADDGIGYLITKMEELFGVEVPDWVRGAASFTAEHGVTSMMFGPAYATVSALRSVAGAPGEPGQGGKASLKVTIDGDASRARVTDFFSEGMELELERGFLMGGV